MRKSYMFPSYALIVMFSLVLTNLREIEAEDKTWPHFRGPNSSGHAAKDAQPPVKFGPDQNVVWKAELPEGHSSPCIWEDKIFVTGYIKDKEELQTICISRTSGKILWRQTINPEEIENYHAVGNAASSSPTTDGKNVYVYFGSYGLICYDLNGRLVWKKTIAITENWFGAAASLIATNDLLILNHDLHKDSYLMAISKSTGDLVWKVVLPEVSDFPDNSSYSTPVVMNDQVILHRCWEISAYSLNDGSRLWWLPTPTSGVSTPIFNQNTLYIGTWQEMGEKEQIGELPDFETMSTQHDSNGDGFISREEIPDSMAVFIRPEMNDVEYGSALKVKDIYEMIDKNKDRLVDNEEWDGTVELFSKYYLDSGLMALNLTGKGELPISQVLWKIKDKVPEVPSPIYYDGCVYMIKNGGIITCVDAESGKILYRERLGASGPYFASPIVANGNLYIPSGKGVITVLKASRSLDVLAQNKLKEKIFATPAVIDNTLYVRTLKHLYAFETTN
jgi:outer membrane protein assembly factor BamB